jgi:hypothetical protein
MRRLLESADKPTAGVMSELWRIGKLAVFGGAVRDVARRGVAAFRSDFDLVVYDSDRANFLQLMASLDARSNKFGGYRIPLPSWHVDVWMLEDTWANTAGHQQVSSIADLVNCTFFTCDAAVFDIQSGVVFFSEDYLEELRRGWIELNLLENPNPTGALIRAIRRAILWRGTFGPRLQDFVARQLSVEDWSTLVRIDAEAFSRNPILKWCDEADLVRLVGANLTWQAVRNPGVTEQPSRQLPLPFD